MKLFIHQLAGEIFLFLFSFLSSVRELSSKIILWFSLNFFFFTIETGHSLDNPMNLAPNFEACKICLAAHQKDVSTKATPSFYSIRVCANKDCLSQNSSRIQVQGENLSSNLYRS